MFLTSMVQINNNNNTYVSNNPESTFRIFPNPVRDKINIMADEIIDRVEVFTLSGMKILEKAGIYNSRLVLDVNNIPQGLLILKIHNGEREQTRKVTKL